MKTPILRHFTFGDLPEGNLRDMAELFSDLAIRVDISLPESEEKSAALRKLLEARNAAVTVPLDLTQPPD